MHHPCMHRSARKPVFTLFLFIFFIVFLPFRTAHSFSYQSNQVNMPVSASGYTLITGTYQINSFSISPDQDPSRNIYNGLSKSYSGNNGSMTFSIGRHGTSQVATWFKNQISSNQNTFNHDPDDLNFAFLGTLTLKIRGGELGINEDTYTLSDIAIAQGHSGGNNWWFGGKSCQNIGSSQVRCTGTSSSGFNVDFVFLRGGNDNSTINLTSISFPGYKTYPLQSQYRGENSGCVWQSPDKCPPYVTYYDASQSRTLRLIVSNNKLFNDVGHLFDTSNADNSHSGRAAIFVMSQAGEIYASNANKVYLFHHSSILGGVPVAAAGELIVSQGIIQRVTNCSGHYRPDTQIFTQLQESLKRKGYTRSFSTVSCSPGQLLIDLDYNPVVRP